MKVFYLMIYVIVVLCFFATEKHKGFYVSRSFRFRVLEIGTR